MNEAYHGYVLLLDINAPWVRSLFCSLPGVLAGQQRLRGWRIQSVSCWLRSRNSRTPASPNLAAPGLVEAAAIIPGWSLAHLLSTIQVRRIVEGTLARFGRPAAIVYTLPQYAGVAERFAAQRQVYYAYDPYRFYSGWNPARVVALETRMLNACSMAFGISRQLVEDLQQCGKTPVYYSPNAVHSAFLGVINGTSYPVPEDLAHLRGKIVGCIGQFDPHAYDWTLIETLSRRFPEVTYVFVGGRTSTHDSAAAPMNRALSRRNVLFLGPQPHWELTRYLSRFDVCLNPLAVTDHNHRRSPLRLYDYLATPKPILSTALREAREMADHVTIGHDPEDCSAKLGQMLDSAWRVDVESRKKYILANTWEKRAGVLWRTVLAGSGSPGP